MFVLTTKETAGIAEITLTCPPDWEFLDFVSSASKFFEEGFDQVIPFQHLVWACNGYPISLPVSTGEAQELIDMAQDVKGDEGVYELSFENPCLSVVLTPSFASRRHLVLSKRVVSSEAVPVDTPAPEKSGRSFFSRLFHVVKNK